MSPIKEFGAFVEFLPGKDGLVHISELANFRVKKTEDIVKVGDEITVKCLGVDEKGRVRLSRKAAMEDRDKEMAGKEPSPPKPSNPGQINSSAGGPVEPSLQAKADNRPRFLLWEIGMGREVLQPILV